MSIYSMYKTTTTFFFGETSEEQMQGWYNKSCERLTNLAVGGTFVLGLGLSVLAIKTTVTYVAGDDACLVLNATNFLAQMSGADETTTKAVTALTSLFLGNPKC